MDERGQPRILITRLSALGDCVTTLPVVCALRDQFPLARLVWLSQPENVPLLRAHSDLDEVITVHRRWFRRPNDIQKLRIRLQAENLTAVIDPQSLSKSSAAGWLSGCPTRVGLGYPLGREIAPILNTICVDLHEQTHVIDRFLALLRPLGVDQPEVNFRIPRDPESENHVAQFIQRENLQGQFVVINPGAGWKSRRWDMTRYGHLAARLEANFGVRSVVNWYGTDELEWGQQIVQCSQGSALLAPSLDLFGLSALLRKARLFIGSDCGPMHLSVAVETPCVALHGTTLPEISGPYGSRNIALQEYYHSGSSRERRAANNDAMLAISVESVFDACLTILSRPQPATGEGKWTATSPQTNLTTTTTEIA